MAYYGYDKTPQLFKLMDKVLARTKFHQYFRENRNLWGQGNTNVFLSPNGKEKVEAIAILLSSIMSKK